MPKAAALSELARLGIHPRGLNIDLAAAYVGLGRSAFLAEVDAGNLPRPIRLSRTRRLVWDRAALDAAMNGIGEETWGQIDTVMHAIRGGA